MTRRAGARGRWRWRSEPPSAWAFRLAQTVSYSGRWSFGIYPNWLRVSLTLIVPIGIAVTLPSDALTGRLSSVALVIALVSSGAVVTASRWIFRRGIRAYSGASA